MSKSQGMGMLGAIALMAMINSERDMSSEEVADEVFTKMFGKDKLDAMKDSNAFKEMKAGLDADKPKQCECPICQLERADTPPEVPAASETRMGDSAIYEAFRTFAIDGKHVLMARYDFHNMPALEVNVRHKDGTKQSLTVGIISVEERDRMFNHITPSELRAMIAEMKDES